MKRKLFFGIVTMLMLLIVTSGQTMAQTGTATIGGSIFFAVLLCGVVWMLAGLLGALGGGIAQALAD